jgi:hypothetical protein
VKDLVLEITSHAISFYNSQPFKFKFVAETQFEIFVDPHRFLLSSDPHLKNIQMSFGALLETLELGLLTRGLTLQLKTRIPTHASMNECWGHGEVLVGSKKRSEFAMNDLERRFSYRGGFNKSANEAWKILNKITEPINVSHLARLIINPEIQSEVARLFDQMNIKYLQSPGSMEYLYPWLRFSPKNPQWSLDGLNAKALAVSRINSISASLLLKPVFFRSLIKTGIAKAFVSDASKIKAAMGLWVIYAPREANFVEMGRIFMREWLRMTQKGLFGAPLSVLADEPSIQGDLKTILGIPASGQIVNILRAGPLPPSYRKYPRARLKAEDLVINEDGPVSN